jgi:hypothetical protein
MKVFIKKHNFNIFQTKYSYIRGLCYSDYGFQYCISTKLAYMLGCFFSEELNTLLFKSVQKFIRQTCRFNNKKTQKINFNFNNKHFMKF